MPALTRSRFAPAAADHRHERTLMRADMRADEPPPRQAVIAPDEAIAVVSHVSATHGPITAECARGATLRRGERVLVVIADETWIGVVRRVSSHGALVSEESAHF